MRLVDWESEMRDMLHPMMRLARFIEGNETLRTKFLEKFGDQFVAAMDRDNLSQAIADFERHKNEQPR
jgi:hypothetical protein